MELLFGLSYIEVKQNYSVITSSNTKQEKDHFDSGFRRFADKLPVLLPVLINHKIQETRLFFVQNQCYRLDKLNNFRSQWY